jgi:LPXTG-site transpeptidase (sortase) family protein
MIVRIKARWTPRIRAAVQAMCVTTFCAGAALAAWAAYVAGDSEFTQWAGSRAFAAGKGDQRETIVPKVPSAASRGLRVPRGTVLGKFGMPRLGLSFVLLEGTDARTLDRSIGRVEASGRLGEPGNIGIAGHRNTHFRKLEWVRRGDEVVLTTHNGEYRYLVEWVHLFSPDALEVLDPAHGPAVTLITCFPFEYVGSAPLRFVVRALPDDATRAKLSAALPAPMARK